MIPAHTVGVRAHIAGAKDSHGNATDDWAAPVDVAVYAIAPRMSNEPDPGRAEVITGLSLLAPPGTAVGPRDRVVVDGVEYEVDGEVGDWTRGPYGFAPGVAINLTRTEG